MNILIEIYNKEHTDILGYAETTDNLSPLVVDVTKSGYVGKTMGSIPELGLGKVEIKRIQNSSIPNPLWYASIGDTITVESKNGLIILDKDRRTKWWNILKKQQQR